MAYLKSESELEFKAAEQGLFVIDTVGNSLKIINSDDFNPKDFSEKPKEINS